MFYEYTIAGCRILLSLPFVMNTDDVLDPFLRLLDTEPDPDSYDWRMTYEPVPDLPELPKEAVLKDQCCCHSTGIWHCLVAGDPALVYACTLLPEGEDRLIRVLYREDRAFYMDRTRKIFLFLIPELFLLRLQGFILHASLIRVRGKAILFSAPSGTGKSTQAELWRRHRGAEVLNGDRAALRCIDGEVRAYGLPIAGSSEIFRNESAPVEAIVILGQAPENRVRPVGPAEALRSLFPEVSKHPWNREAISRLLDLLTWVLTDIPVWRLDCVPDVTAVECLEAALYPEESERSSHHAVDTG